MSASGGSASWGLSLPSRMSSSSPSTRSSTSVLRPIDCPTFALPAAPNTTETAADAVKRVHSAAPRGRLADHAEGPESASQLNRGYMGHNLRMQDSPRNSGSLQPQPGPQNQGQTQSAADTQSAAQTQSAALAPGRRPRIGIPVRLSSSADPDPRVAKANGLFGCIISLIRDVGGEPVLLTPESVAGLNGGPAGGGKGPDGLPGL